MLWIINLCRKPGGGVAMDVFLEERVFEGGLEGWIGTLLGGKWRRWHSRQSKRGVPATLHGTFVQMIKRYFFLKTFDHQDFHCGPVVKNPSCNTGDVGLIPGWGTKIPHATEQLNLCIITREPVCPQEKIPHAATQTQCSQIKQTKEDIWLPSARK